MMSSNSDGTNNPALDDNSSDPTGEPYYARLVNISGIDFYTGKLQLNGTWRLRVCDVRTGTSGTFNRARLVLTSTQTTPIVCTGTSTVNWGANGNNNPVTAPLRSGDTTFTLTSNRDLTNDEVTEAGRDPFTTQTSVFGGQSGHYLMQYDDGANGMQQDPEAVLLETNWSFSPAVRQLTWKHLDVDNGSWEDYVRTTATDANGNNVPYELRFETGTVDQQAGDIVETDGANVDANDIFGNVTYVFNGPVTNVTVQYLRGDDFADPAEQRIGVGDPFWCTYDFGDAPNTYGTSLATSGAHHVLGSRLLYMGANPPDGETDGQATAGATGDNTAQVSGVNDEDGVASFPICPQNGTYSVTVNVTNNSGSNGFLVGYIDWDRNGAFNTGNERSATATVATGTNGSNVVLTWSSVPANCGNNSTTSAAYARFRFTTSQTRAQSPTDGAGLWAPDGEVEDYQIPAGTLPVTLSSFATERDRGGITVSWTTDTETSTVGYAILGVNAKGTKRLTPKLIEATSVDSLTPQHYRVTVPDGGFDTLILQDVSRTGKAKDWGPFQLGQAYGREPEVHEIDWTAVRSELTAALTPARAAVAADEARWGGGGSRTAELAELRVDQEGVHRVTYDDLVAAGVDLGSVSAGQLKLIEARSGAVIPLDVHAGAGPYGTFGPGSYLEFRGEAVADSLYTRSRAYQLWTTPSGGSNVAVRDGRPRGALVASYSQTDAINRDLLYNFSSPNGDPWYEAALLAQGGAVEQSFPIASDERTGGAGRLEVGLWGVTDWPGGGLDHHVKIYLNGLLLKDDRFDGLTARNYSLNVPAGLLVDGDNQLTVELPGDTGFEFDLVHVDRYALTYPRHFVARGGKLSFTASGGRVEVDGLSSSDVEVFASSGQVRLDGVAIEPSAAGWRVRFTPPATHWRGNDQVVDVVESSALLHPQISLPRRAPQGLLSGRADYLIISHPLFLDDLGPLVAARQGDGLRVKTVDVFDLYQAYTGGEIDPEAIHAYIVDAARRLGVRYVLLVGGDSYDYLDHLGIGSVSFIPTLYAQTDEFIYFTPADSLLADVNGDDLQDLAIGRLPARSRSELQLLIDKTLRYPTTPAGLLLAADEADDGHFAAISDGMAAAAPPAWPATRAYIDTLGLAGARASLLSGLNSGNALVNFVGHSGPTVWTFSGLFSAGDPAGLTNVTAPAAVVQWGCWNTYHVTPQYDTLAHRLLLDGPQGAAAVVGSSTLTKESSDEVLGPELLARLFVRGARIGDAIVRAKQAVSATGGDLRDVLVSWTLLGDPALVVNP